MKHIYLLFLGLPCLSVLFSQSLKGSVYDADTRKPLAGVTIEDGNTLIQSGADGSFTLPNKSESIQVTDYHVDSATTWTTSLSYIDYFNTYYATRALATVYGPVAVYTYIWGIPGRSLSILPIILQNNSKTRTIHYPCERKYINGTGHYR